MRFVIEPLTTEEHKPFYYNKFLTKFSEEDTPERTHLLIWNMGSVREMIHGITPQTIKIFLDLCCILNNEFSYNFLLCCFQDYDYDFGKYISSGEMIKDLERCIEDEPDERVSDLLERLNML